MNRNPWEDPKDNGESLPFTGVEMALWKFVIGDPGLYESKRRSIEELQDLIRSINSSTSEGTNAPDTVKLDLILSVINPFLDSDLGEIVHTKLENNPNLGEFQMIIANLKTSYMKKKDYFGEDLNAVNAYAETLCEFLIKLMACKNNQEIQTLVANSKYIAILG